MKYKINQLFYSPDYDEETGKCELDTYKVRTIRGGFVYAIAVYNGVTWGKRSKKHGDIGWLNPINPLFRRRTSINSTFFRLHTTRRKAWSSLLQEAKKDKYIVSEEIRKKIIKTIKSNITRLPKKKRFK